MDGSQVPGDLDTWDYMGTDPNEILTYTYDILAQRSTTLYHTHPPVKAAIDKQTDYAIGPGLVFRSQPDYTTLGVTKEAAKEWGMRFQKLVHYTSKLLNWYEKQSVNFRTSLIMGDSLLLFDRVTPPPGLPFDLVEIGGDQIQFNKEGTTLGIYVDALLRRRAISLNGNRVNFIDGNGDQNVLQFYLKLMSRQLRGYPLAYGIIAAAKNNSRWWDATLARAVLESIVFASSSGNGGANEVDKNAEYMANVQKGLSGQTQTDLTNTTKPQDLTTGGIWNFSNDRNIEFTVLQTPGKNFKDLNDAFIEIVGMQTGTPGEVIKSLYSTSYTAHKGALNDFIKSYMNRRIVHIEKVNRPVTREIAKYLFMSGLIEPLAPGFFDNAIIQTAMLAGNYLGPVPGHINPAQEVKAKADAVANAFMLRSDGAAEYGNEFTDYIEEWNQEQLEWFKGTPENMAASVAADLQGSEIADDEGTEEDEDMNKDMNDDGNDENNDDQGDNNE